MKTENIEIAMDKKRAEVIEEIKKRSNKEVHKATGMPKGYISDLKKDRPLFQNYKKICQVARDLGI